MDASQPFHKMVCHFLSEHTRFLSRHLTYITRSGIATGLKRSGGFGFVPRQCTSEEVFYCSLDLRGKVVYDVGSNEGIFSLFSARAVGSGGTVVSFEPNPEAYRRTVRNLELNHFECQLYTVNTALGEARGARDMWCPSGETARSTLREDLADKYVRDGEKCSAFRVSIEKLDDLAGIKFPAPDFIKIDTEGHEAAVLCGAAHTLCRYRPEVFLELHGTSPENWHSERCRLHSLLEGYGYQVLDMNRKEVSVDDSTSHLYCQPWDRRAWAVSAPEIIADKVECV